MTRGLSLSTYGRYQMKIVAFTLVSLLCLLSCQAKKAPETEVDDKAQQEELDYRAALQSYKIGINHIHAGELAEAVRNLKIAVSGDSTNFRYRHGLGLALSLSGNLDEAIVQLKECLKINPSFSEASNLLGSIYSDAGKYEEAIECFKTVIQDKSYPEPQFAYFNLGKVKRLQGRPDEAIAAYTVTTQIDPKFFRAYIAMGEIYKERKDWDKMLHYYQKAEPNYGNDVNVLFNIGYALFRLKEYERAKSYLAQVSILFPPPQIDKNTQDMLKMIENIMRKRN